VSTLHTVNKSPFEREALASCLRVAAAGSSVLLIEDGVYAAVRGTAFELEVRAAGSRLAFYVLQADLAARGMGEAPLIAGVERVDYGGFVDLAAAHDRVQAWL
jgi:tRNA 2-thiouridine synthesizing protein B